MPRWAVLWPLQGIVTARLIRVWDMSRVGDNLTAFVRIKCANQVWESSKRTYYKRYKVGWGAGDGGHCTASKHTATGSQYCGRVGVRCAGSTANDRPPAAGGEATSVARCVPRADRGAACVSLALRCRARQPLRAQLPIFPMLLLARRPTAHALVRLAMLACRLGR